MSNDIRGNWKTIYGGKLAGWLIYLLGFTFRVEVKGWRDEFADPDRQLIHVFWHNRICGLLPLWTKRFKTRETVVLASASKDGAAIEAAVGVYGVGSVRGSSSRRGVAALIALKKAAKSLLNHFNAFGKKGFLTDSAKKWASGWMISSGP